MAKVTAEEFHARIARIEAAITTLVEKKDPAYLTRDDVKEELESLRSQMAKLLKDNPRHARKLPDEKSWYTDFIEGGEDIDTYLFGSDEGENDE